MKAEGDCYFAAARFLLSLGVDTDARLVHGEVTGQGDVAGVRYGHAWVEINGFVIDPSNGRKLCVLPTREDRSHRGAELFLPRIASGNRKLRSLRAVGESVKLAPDQERLLRMGLYSSCGAAGRWKEHQRLDDDALRRCIGEAFGIVDGYGKAGERIEYRGGANPGAIIQIGDDPPLVLEGRELLAAVREALGIGHPSELF